jgi:hypothetical protein
MFAKLMFCAHHFIPFSNATTPSHMTTFMYVLFNFLCKNSEAIIAQVQELKAYKRPIGHGRTRKMTLLG